MYSEGGLEGKLPTRWAEKQRWEESEKKREKMRRRKKINEESRKKEDPGSRKGRKVEKQCGFPMIYGSGGSKSGGSGAIWPNER